MSTEPTDFRDQAQAAADQAAAPDDQAQPKDPAAIIAELQARISSLEDSLLRSRADFQNLQRRSAAERSEAIRYANADLMKTLLSVVDDFDRSLSAAEKAENAAAVMDGVRLVQANLNKALADFGLESIDARGQRFDPMIHEALLQQPTAEVEPGTVIEQVAKGYRLRDRVLRPARVIVAKAPQGSPVAESTLDR